MERDEHGREVHHRRLPMWVTVCGWILVIALLLPVVLVVIDLLWTAVTD